MKRVLVTGASGFVGRYAVAALAERGFEVHAISNRPSSSDVSASLSKGVASHHAVDLTDAHGARTTVAALRPSHLLHLAWYAEPGLYWRSAANLDWVAASLALTRAFREIGGERAVVAGSCAEYAWGPDYLSEDAPCVPVTLYGAAKDGTRRVLEAYAREVGLSFAWGRLFYLYGPGEKPGRLVSDAMRALREGNRFATSPGHQRRDFSHVADVGAAFAALVDCDVQGPVNVGSGEATPVRAMLQRIGLLTKRENLIDFGARALPQNEPPCIAAKVNRLRHEVGFHPRYDIDSGLSETYEDFMSHGNVCWK